MGKILAAFLLSLAGGGGLAAVATVATVQAVQSSSANKGDDAPPADVESVSYADE